MKSQAQQTAEYTLNALGGISRLTAMIGAQDFTHGMNRKNVQNTSFRFRGSRTANFVSFSLCHDDTYTVSFIKIKGLNYQAVSELKGIELSNLRMIFESVTGLYLNI
jgi:hypothetical protein